MNKQRLAVFFGLILMLLSEFPLTVQGLDGPVRESRITLDRLEFNCRPILDPQGNFIGVTIPLAAMVSAATLKPQAASPEPEN